MVALGEEAAGAEFWLVPAAVLAAPGAHVFADAEGDPTDGPKAKREEGQRKVQQMVDLCVYEDLLVPAPRAMSAYFILFHLAGPRSSIDRQHMPQENRYKDFTNALNING
jgi:hypothetical protein